jgi:hypothetical protein
LLVEAAGEADDRRTLGPADRVKAAFEPDVERELVGRVVASDHVQDEGGVTHATAEHADVVEALRQDDGAPRADKAVSRLQPDDAAVSRWPQHRAHSLAADRNRNHAGGDCGRRTARRAAGGVLQVPRVPRRGWITIGELGSRSLAENNRPGAAKASNDCRVLGRKTMSELACSRARRQATNVEDVLDTDRHAEEAAGDSAVLARLVPLSRHKASPGAVYLYPGLEALVEQVDALDRRFEEVDGGVLAEAYAVGGGAGAEHGASLPPALLSLQTTAMLLEALEGSSLVACPCYASNLQSARTGNRPKATAGADILMYTLEDEREDVQAEAPRYRRRAASFGPDESIFRSSRVPLLTGVFFVGLLLFLAIEPTQPWMLLVLTGLIALGADGILRTHPRGDFAGDLAGTSPFLFLPALLTLGAGLFLEDIAPAYWAVPGAVIASVVMAAVLYADHISIDPEDVRYPAARLVLSIATYLTAFAFYSVVYTFDIALIPAAIAVGLVTMLLSVEVLREAEADPVRALVFAGVIGLVVAEARWGLYFLPLESYLAAVFLLLVFYLASGLVQHHLMDDLRGHVVVEFVVIALVGVVIVALGRIFEASALGG